MTFAVINLQSLVFLGCSYLKANNYLYLDGDWEKME
jgi:hypothetical protein